MRYSNSEATIDVVIPRINEASHQRVKYSVITIMYLLPKLEVGKGPMMSKRFRNGNRGKLATWLGLWLEMFANCKVLEMFRLCPYALVHFRREQTFASRVVFGPQTQGVKLLSKPKT